MEILNKIQRELKAPKGQRNTFGNYNYRSCEDILEAVKPLLGTATLILNDEIVMVGDRFYVKATATLNGGGNTSVVSATAFARESLEKKGMDSAQVTGAASSYARKYALNGLFCIDDTKDADHGDNRVEVKPVAKPKAKETPVNEKKVRIVQQLKQLGRDVKSATTCTIAVQELTQLALAQENYDEISSRLAILISEIPKVAKQPATKA